MASAYRYLASSKWCGWWGGWGSENDIARHIEAQAAGGYRLVRTESRTSWWFFCIPRPKMLFIFEREGVTQKGPGDCAGASPFVLSLSPTDRFDRNGTGLGCGPGADCSSVGPYRRFACNPDPNTSRYRWCAPYLEHTRLRCGRRLRVAG